MKEIRLHFQHPERRGEGEQSGSQLQVCYETLLRQAQDGNEKAREELCQFVFASARKYARIVGLPALYDLEDFAQDLTVELVQQLGRIQRLRSWLPAVLIRQRALAFRRYHYDLISSFEKSESSIIAESAEFSAAEQSLQTTRLDFQVVVNRLPEPHKAIMILHCVDSLHFDDISKILGLTPSNVRMHFLRTKKRLRKHLNLHHGEDSSHGNVASRAPEAATCASR